MELFFEFMIVDPGIPGSHDQNAARLQLEGQRLGDTRTFHAKGFGCQLHRSAGHIEFLYPVCQAELFQMCSGFLHGHW